MKGNLIAGATLAVLCATAASSEETNVIVVSGVAVQAKSAATATDGFDARRLSGIEVGLYAPGMNLGTDTSNTSAPGLFSILHEKGSVDPGVVELWVVHKGKDELGRDSYGVQKVNLEPDKPVRVARIPDLRVLVDDGTPLTAEEVEDALRQIQEITALELLARESTDEEATKDANARAKRVLMRAEGIEREAIQGILQRSQERVDPRLQRGRVWDVRGLQGDPDIGEYFQDPGGVWDGRVRDRLHDKRPLDEWMKARILQAPDVDRWFTDAEAQRFLNGLVEGTPMGGPVSLGLIEGGRTVGNRLSIQGKISEEETQSWLQDNTANQWVLTELLKSHESSAGRKTKLQAIPVFFESRGR